MKNKSTLIIAVSSFVLMAIIATVSFAFGGCTKNGTDRTASVERDGIYELSENKDTNTERPENKKPAQTTPESEEIKDRTEQEIEKTAAEKQDGSKPEENESRSAETKAEATTGEAAGSPTTEAPRAVESAPSEPEPVQTSPEGETSPAKEPEAASPSPSVTEPEVTSPAVPEPANYEPETTSPPVTEPETTVPETTEEPKPERTDPPAIDFTVYDMNGNAVKLSDYFGKPIVLNFWASWCAPCKMEMPDFNAKYEELEGEVVFLMINVTGVDTVEDAKKVITDNGYTFPVFFDTDSQAKNAYGITAFPTTYFIDAEGYLIAYARGAISAETLQEGIDMIS